MKNLTNYIVDLLDNADTVPDYLEATLPAKYKPKRLLQKLSAEELIKVRKG